MAGRDEPVGREDAGCRCPADAVSPGTALTRRRLLGALGVAGAGLAIGAGTRYSFAASPRPAGDVLVCVFLRGGSDALSLLAPLGDPNYAQLRPTVAVPASKGLKLDRFYAMHPKMAPLLPAWRNGDLAFVVAAGDRDALASRSHFDMQDAMERGVEISSPVYTGWVDRHFTSRPQSEPVFPSVAIGSTEPTSLRGPSPDVTLNDVGDFRIDVADADLARVTAALHGLHDGVAGPVSAQGRLTLDAVRLLARYRGHPYVPRSGVTYPSTDLGHGLFEAAALIKSGIGLEAVCLDMAGWDVHAGMGTVDVGSMADLAKNFATAMAAFYADLGPLMGGVTVVTMTEFGRTVAENGSQGTDHGFGGGMMLMGGGIRGGRVYGRWPGLAANQLDVSGDLRVTTDYRDVLAEVVAHRLANPRVSQVFPTHQARYLGVADPR